MSNNPYRTLLNEMAAELDWSQQRLMGNRKATHSLADRARALLDQHPEPESAADCLAARQLMEKVAAMGDCIGQHTVGEIIAISGQAAAWLAANPPGQPVAIEPLGYPLPEAEWEPMPLPPEWLAPPVFNT